MKKSLLLSAAAMATVLGVNAQDAPGVVSWDFNTHGIFVNFQDPEDPFLFQAGNYDFVDKNGSTVNTDGESMVTAIKTTPENGSAYNTNYGKNNRLISFYDGATYLMHEAAADDAFALENGYEVLKNAQDAEVLNHPFAGWTQAGEDGKSLGPARIIWMKGWGSLEGFEDKDYNGVTESDWVATRHALSFDRCGQGEGSMESYVQFPEVQLPCKITYYVGTGDPNGKNGKYSSELRVDFQAVKDGEELERYNELTLATGEFTGKRMYKKEVTFAGTGKASFRIWSRGRVLHIYHVVFDSNYNGENAKYTVGDAGVENVTIDNVEAANAPMYNLYGQKVNKDYKGIVIQNGKKYILK